jgi:hypothetical protein
MKLPMTTAQVARQLGCCHKSVLNYHKRKLLVGTLEAGRLWFNQKDVARFQERVLPTIKPGPKER